MDNGQNINYGLKIRQNFAYDLIFRFRRCMQIAGLSGIILFIHDVICDTVQL